MAKLTRETRLRERRVEKQARKDARRLAAERGEGEGFGVPVDGASAPDPGQPPEPGAPEPPS